MDPIKAKEALENNYQRYLSTTFRLQDTELQKQLLENLREKGKFVKGPILEVTPEYRKGACIADLVEEGLLSEEFYRLQVESLPVQRKLYDHQEKAVRKLTSDGRNIMVSTGTGSGKTEAFLIPILDYLFKEKENGALGPGVRALLLYPMNALANDQLKRLRLLLAILLTNYAMLEYLLLRPEDTQMWEQPPHIEAKRLQLERDLHIALSEYAPSSQVVAGGRLWTSRYIRRLPGKAWESFYYAICDECQNYISERAELTGKKNYCNVCGSKLGKNQGRFIIPAFGFIVGQDYPGTPGEEKPEKTYSTRVYFSGQTSGDEDHTLFQLGGGIEAELTSASLGKLAVINNAGYNGFQVCHTCGFTILGSESVPNSHQSHWGSPYSGKLQRHLSLGYEFETDILKMCFHGYHDERKGFWYSLLYALLEGVSTAMQIERDDLDGCLHPMPGNPFGNFALILFDDVPGGAGHVRRLAREDSFKEILYASMDRLQRCECGGDKGQASCYGCLRHYDNQFCHSDLNRGMVIEFLSKVLD
jgi:hypothetical protein